MAVSSSLPALEHWYAALRSPAGICIEVTDGTPESYRQLLYRARRDSADFDLDALSVMTSPTNPAELWIVHNGKAKP